MKVHPILTLACFFLFALPLSAQHPAGECKAKITYDNRNQIENRPLSITVVSGIAQDKDQVPISNVCLGLFTEREHRLVETAVTRMNMVQTRHRLYDTHTETDRIFV